MQQPLEQLLRKRRDRSIAVILSAKERECDASMTAMGSTRFRKVVLDQVNEFYDLALDVMSSLDTGEVVLNETYLHKLNEVHQTVMEMANGGEPTTSSRAS